MRIVAGAFRGRKIRPPLSLGTRPTSDRTRETIFNILTHHLRMKGQTFSDYVALDVFAGTGALGLEALSRGVSFATFIEQDVEALQVLRANIHDLNLDKQAAVIQTNALHLKASNQAFSLVFLDPPYQKNMVLECLKSLEEGRWLAPSALIICEVGPREEIIFPPYYSLITERRFGHCKIFVLAYHSLT
jgi:16S rRNA (guanine966-N2)-methyltransferase